LRIQSEKQHKTVIPKKEGNRKQTLKNSTVIVKVKHEKQTLQQRLRNGGQQIEERKGYPNKGNCEGTECEPREALCVS
jgi:hypothetical protein